MERLLSFKCESKLVQKNIINASHFLKNINSSLLYLDEIYKIVNANKCKFNVNNS